LTEGYWANTCLASIFLTRAGSGRQFTRNYWSGSSVWIRRDAEGKHL